MLRIGICSASLLDAMFDNFPTSHTPIEREKFERSYRERVEEKLGYVPDFGKALARLSRGVYLPHKVNVKEVKVGGKEMLEAREGLMGRLQPMLMKLAALEARAVMLERTRAAEGKDSQGEEVIKPYTPTTLDSDLGHFDLVIKVYETDNSKTRVGRATYQPGRVGVIGMLAADYGITPMFQVARAILESPSDTTKVHLIYVNDTYEDILLKESNSKVSLAVTMAQMHEYVF
ncbi:hypothetical protein RHSIM_Rhsim08G0072000 [Rhododendron simsii]|uniref:Uncharacterized protein n=1 Tax=Rhododendron simsii TaxID=118357 RepID=A0A834GIY9_RHOSS|nr:hypothetical protein RHSIM_Rhsim08G0072000 [Rhododendron simsii]